MDKRSLIGLLLIGVTFAQTMNDSQQASDVQSTDKISTSPLTSGTTQQPQPTNFVQLCRKCERPAINKVGAFMQYKYYEEYSALRGESAKFRSYKDVAVQAGIKHCGELRYSYHCFLSCEAEGGYALKSLPPGHIYHQLKDFVGKYCEEPWGGESCRMADVRECDRRFNLTDCDLFNDRKEPYMDCRKGILEHGGQNCSGLCSPARRFHTIQLFNHELKCSLSSRVPGHRCREYVDVYCLEKMKTSRGNWGKFENFHIIEPNLVTYCPKLIDVEKCMNEAVIATLNFSNPRFYAEKPCNDKQTEIYRLKTEWINTIRAPLCDWYDPWAEDMNFTHVKTNINDICGQPPTTIRIPMTVPATTPIPINITTEARWKRVRPRKNGHKHRNRQMKGSSSHIRAQSILGYISTVVITLSLTTHTFTLR